MCKSVPVAMPYCLNTGVGQGGFYNFGLTSTARDLSLETLVCCWACLLRRLGFLSLEIGRHAEGVRGGAVG